MSSEEIDITGDWYFSWAPPNWRDYRYLYEPWTKQDWENLHTGYAQSSRIGVNFKKAKECEDYLGYFTAPTGAYNRNRGTFYVRVRYSSLADEFYLCADQYTEVVRPNESERKAVTYTEHNTGPVVSILYEYKIDSKEGVKHKDEVYAGFLRKDKSRGKFMYGVLYATTGGAVAVWMMSDRYSWS